MRTPGARAGRRGHAFPRPALRRRTASRRGRGARARAAIKHPGAVRLVLLGRDYGLPWRQTAGPPAADEAGEADPAVLRAEASELEVLAMHAAQDAKLSHSAFGERMQVRSPCRTPPLPPRPNARFLRPDPRAPHAPGPPQLPRTLVVSCVDLDAAPPVPATAGGGESPGSRGRTGGPGSSPARGQRGLRSPEVAATPHSVHSRAAASHEGSHHSGSPLLQRRHGKKGKKHSGMMAALRRKRADAEEKRAGGRSTASRASSCALWLRSPY